MTSPETEFNDIAFKRRIRFCVHMHYRANRSKSVKFRKNIKSFGRTIRNRGFSV